MKERHKDKKAERQKTERQKTERQKTERQKKKDRETERQRDKGTERQRDRKYCHSYRQKCLKQKVTFKLLVQDKTICIQL